MKKYKLLISIPIHERLEVVIDQILNVKYCADGSAIVIHFSPSYKDKNSCITKSDFMSIVNQFNFVFVNPESVRTGMDDIIQAHMSNYEYAKTQCDFEYFCICASNESFIKKGVYEYVNQYDAGTFQRDIEGWIYEKELTEDSDLQDFLKKNQVKRIMATYPEGQFFRSDIMDIIHNQIKSFYDYNHILSVYPRDEIFYATLVGHLKDRDKTLKVGTPYTYSAYHLTHLWNVTRIRIAFSLCYNPTIYSAKRVDRYINDSIRVYLRQKLGYQKEEENLLSKYCEIKKYSTLKIDLSDLQKMVFPIFSNFTSVLSRFGLAPRKKGKMPL